ncbi:hypothetical protein FB567DRAFT_556111 [Paraphoma chrysanthemicola]|uniref:Peptidase S33 tripeptidyl aminopeptidase-like C-terminal domain-containing protein n=1 Tax=Paraphoma chrysanthemicola TaxID=798071 RepID=A0A8K0REF4_9PLEO|nr:hypothetical protein FB567DRAFT_556111 [Paraphoma chrysanthemicola]
MRFNRYAAAAAIASLPTTFASPLQQRQYNTSMVNDFDDLLIATIGPSHNFVGFDPRGVNNSGPDLSCFPGEEGTSRFYTDLTVPIDVTNKKSYAEMYQNAAAFGDFCTKAHSAANDTAKYANTVAVVNDLRYYTELLAKSKGQDPTKSQLWSYGASYGSVLGTTYAALFPDRVGRVVVDGIVDGEDYYQGKWANSIEQADEAFRYFFQACYDAGKDGNCTFWDKSPKAIEERFQAILEDLAENPIPVAFDIPAIVTVSDLKLLMVGVPYNPVSTFGIFANVLTGLEKRDATLLAQATGVGSRTDECKIVPDALPDGEPRQFIACNDANHRFNLSTYDAWVEHANNLVNTSQYLGEAWASGTSVNCRKLAITPPKSQVFDGYPGANTTSNPLLFISTAVDPVTPLSAAQKMVKRFGGARLLVQENVGHTSTSAVSECTYGVLQRYFSDKLELPEEGRRCKVDNAPFEDARVPLPAKMRKRSLPGL